MKKTKVLISFLAAGIFAVSSLAPLPGKIVSDCSASITAYAVSAPAKVTVKSSYTCTTNAIRINWNKVSGASGYRVYRYNSAAKKWVKITTIKNGSTTTYRDSGLSNGTLYKYKVKAYTKSGGVTTWGLASDTKPAATKSKQLTMKTTNKTYDAIRLNWNKTTGNGYQIYQYISDSWVKIATVRDVNTTTYRVENLSPGTTYYFKVRAYRTDGCGKVNAGKCGSIVTVTTKNSEAAQIKEVWKLVNIERAAVGLKPLTLDTTLNKAAAVRVKEIGQVFDHTRPDGSSCFTVLNDYSIDYWSAGENIAMGQGNAAWVMYEWMNSSGHRANILDESYTKIGIGYDSSNNAWVQIFIGD